MHMEHSRVYMRVHAFGVDVFQLNDPKARNCAWKVWNIVTTNARVDEHKIYYKTRTLRTYNTATIAYNNCNDYALRYRILQHIWTWTTDSMQLTDYARTTSMVSRRIKNQPTRVCGSESKTQSNRFLFVKPWPCPRLSALITHTPREHYTPTPVQSHRRQHTTRQVHSC